MSAEIKAIKIEYDGTTFTIDLSQQPKILMENGIVVIKTRTESITLSLPCKVTYVETTGSTLKDVVISNIDELNSLSVYTIDGMKVATLKDDDKLLTLKRGIYIINGKKMIIK